MSRDQQTASEEGLSKSTGQISGHPMSDDQLFQFGNPAEGNISRPDVMSELGAEDEQLLFSRVFPDPHLLSNFGPQDEGSFTFDFGNSNADRKMSESMTPLY